MTHRTQRRHFRVSALSATHGRAKTTQLARPLPYLAREARERARPGPSKDQAGACWEAGTEGQHARLGTPRWTCAAGLSVHTHPHAERALVRARRVQFSSVRARSYGRPNCAARASRSPFVHSDADFVPRLGMPRRPEGAAPRKRGRPRLADDMISKAGLQKRRQRDPNEHAMTALHVALPKPADGLDKACGRHRCAWPTHSGGG